MHAYVSRTRAPRSRRRVEPQLDLPPLFDAPSLVPTFFMLAATKRRPNMMRIPVPGGEGTTSRAPVPTIRVDRDRSLLYGADEQVRITAVEREHGGDLATLWQSETAGNLTTVLKAHPQARFASVVSAADELRGALARVRQEPAREIAVMPSRSHHCIVPPITSDERKRLEEI